MTLHQQHQPPVDRAQIASFVETLYGYLEGYVAVRVFAEKGGPDRPSRTPVLPVDDALAGRIADHAEAAARDGMGLFVVPGVLAAPGPATAASIAAVGVMVADLDRGDVDARRELLESHLGPATLVVASGGRTDDGLERLHLHWRLTEPATGGHLATVARLQRTIAEKVGADTSFGSLHQPIRVAGSIHRKQGGWRAVAIRESHHVEHDLADLAEAVAGLPAPGHAATAGPAGAPASAVDTGRSGATVAELRGMRIREDCKDGISRFGALSKIIGAEIRDARRGVRTPDEARERARQFNASNLEPPWPESRMHREFDALLRKDLSENPAAWERRSSANGPGAPELSDDAIADRFSSTHGDDWRHVAAWGRWLHWDGAVWRRDRIGRSVELVRQTCRAMAGEAEKDGERRRIASDRTIRAVERIARSDPRHAVDVDAWDPGDTLLNTPGGIVDLTTGEFIPHDRAAMCTRMTAVAPGGSAPGWAAFLDRVCAGDRDLIRYLARVCGYALTGETCEHAFFFLHGAGANGPPP